LGRHGLVDYVVSDISCSSMSSCVAVGYSTPCAGSPSVCPVHGLTWVLNGSGWSVRRASGSGYDTVSCVSATWCLGSAARRVALWNGQRWSTTLELRGRRQLAAVSCASATACLAISDDGRLAEQWNGAGFSRVAPPSSPGQ
jgi:hypothetical protein